MELPSFFTTPPSEPPRPSRRTNSEPISNEGKALMFVQFEMVLPRILERVCAGATVNNAIKELRPLIIVEPGAFLMWLKKRPQFYAMYKEAIEVRTEVWTGRYLQHATGIDDEGEATLNDVSRDKIAMDGYKWLISTQNRRDYGDVKQIEVNQQISIVGALDAARARTRSVVEVVDVDALTNSEIRALPAPVDDNDEDDE